MKYLYVHHLGGFSICDEPLDDDCLYCEQCGDSDWLYGSFETFQEFWKLFKDECDIDGSGGYSLNYVYPIIVKAFNLPDNVKYNDDYERACGFCSNGDKEILAKINELTKENVDELYKQC